MASKAAAYLEKLKQLETDKQAAIDELLEERKAIDAQLAKLGYEAPKRGRKPSDPTAAKGKGGRPRKTAS